MQKTISRSRKKWARPEILKLEPYHSEPDGPAIRLDANETPFDLPDFLKTEIWARFIKEPWNRYPDPGSEQLRAALAKLEGVTPDQLVAGNGSDELIRDLLTVCAGPGTRVILPTPTFSMYALLARAAGATVVGVPLNKDWSLDLARILKALNQASSRILFLANPNNPTGYCYPPAQIETLLQSTDRWVVVDEAYRWFAGESQVKRLAVYPHLIILATFSKAMSLAGLRVGYAIAQTEMIELLNRVRLPFNLDRFAQLAAKVTLEHADFWQANVQQVILERERITQSLQSLAGVRVYPSRANFILIRVPQAARIKTALAEQGLAVRGFGQDKPLTDCLRITLGRPQENDQLLQGFQTALAAER